MPSSAIMDALGEVIQLLETTDEQEWTASLRQMKSRFEAGAIDPAAYQHAVRDVLKLFGGIGSLSDLVPYRNGMALRAENDRLAQLRSLLFEAARNDLK